MTAAPPFGVDVFSAGAPLEQRFSQTSRYVIAVWWERSGSWSFTGDSHKRPNLAGTDLIECRALTAIQQSCR